MSGAEKNPLTLVSESFYRELCVSSPAALIATDGSFSVVIWNQAATDLFGVDAARMRGEPLVTVVRQSQREMFTHVLERTGADGVTRELELSQGRPDGRARTLLAVVSALQTDAFDGGVAVWIRDISNRKRLAERLAATEKMASLGTLAGGVAHHFNNMIGGVTTAVDFALTNNDPAACRRALQMTAEAVSRIAKLTQSLLSFAEQDPRRIDLADLTEVVLTFVHLIERPLSERMIGVELELNPVPIVAVEANRMHQVLGNLLSNAEDAMPDGGTLRLSIGCDDHWVWLDFADSGPGIHPKHLPLVFEPFFTTKGLLAGGDGGNPGLGLSVVHGIIMEMGGEIAATSQPGRGAGFRIRFPNPSCLRNCMYSAPGTAV